MQALLFCRNPENVAFFWLGAWMLLVSHYHPVASEDKKHEIIFVTQ